MTIRLVIADDQAMVRAGFRSLLDAEPGLEVVGEAVNGEQAVSAVHRFKPDVVLMDVRMPIMDGIEATQRLADDSAAARILILTTFDLDEYVYRGLKAGASGFLLKDASPERLIEAIHVLAEGDAVLAPSVTRRVVETFARLPSPSEHLLESLAMVTPRERQVLELLARGRSNAEIAADLFLSETTAKTHVSSLLSKLRLRDRVQAVVFAYESGLVRPGEPASRPPAAGG